MTNPRKTLGVTLVSIPVVLFILVHAAFWFLSRGITLPPYEEVNVVTLDQNWTDSDRQWYYHASQGGAFALRLQYEWLEHMEQPVLPFSIVGEVGRFMDPEYITRFGFLPNDRTGYSADSITFGWAASSHSPAYTDTENNPDRLPIGFARDDRFVDPDLGTRFDVIGFTCAACHTGQLNYNGKGILIDGGPALTHLTKFEVAVGLSLVLTYFIPTRFKRFADNVLGEDHTAVEELRLKNELQVLLQEGEDYKKVIEGPPEIYPTEEGFGRLDALGRIGNFVFGMEINEENYDVSDGPVGYPHIWDTPWFNWVQYNGSIMQPMIRNAGESMGVFAAVNFNPEDPEHLWESTVNLRALHEMESLIRGPEPFQGLKPPKWPEEHLPALNADLVARGETLYEEHCQYCHHPVRSEEPPYLADEYWTPVDTFGNRYLDVKLVNIEDVGTDPNTAVNFARRMVNLGRLGQMYGQTAGQGGLRPAGDALPFLVNQTVDTAFVRLGLSEEEEAVWRGMRPDSVRAPLAYLARPLNGIWATPPFLHNGSVPNLYQLLSPLEERDTRFWLGSKEYDPEHVGYRTDPVRGGFLLDTSLPGNSNAGHQFDGDYDTDAEGFDWHSLPKGIIGRTLTHDERMALIEYLKSI